MRILLFSLLCVSLAAQTSQAPVRAVTDPGVITTRQAITPAGIPAIFEGRVYGVDFGADASELWVVSATHVYRLDWRQNRVLNRLPLGGSAGLQGIRYDPVARRAFAPFTQRQDRAVSVSAFAPDATAPLILQPSLGRFLGGALAVASEPNPQGIRVVAVPLVYDNKLALLDAASGKLLHSVATHIAPFGAVLSRKGETAWVSSWGGRIPRPQDLTAPTGYDPNADRVVVDQRGVSASGTVQRVETLTGRITHTLEIDPQPTAIVWDEPRQRLYVAGSNRDRVTVIDTAANQVVRVIPIQPFAEKPYGIQPTALAVSANGDLLYAACGGINAIAVVRTASGAIEGLIPTAWYPTSLALSRDGQRIAVGALLGAGSGWRDEPRKRYVHSYRGSVAVIDLPDAAQLASYTAAVAENNRLTIGAAAAAAPKPDPGKPPVAIPLRAGEPSLIEHVVYIVKENRTYDQVFGDLGKGNGDPSLVMFGAPVTPNQRKLAEEFVLLDNFYATGGNSADGHQWVTQGIQNTYSMWPGFAGRSYPFDGSDPLAIADSGFLWDQALARGKTVRIYGEYAGVTRSTPASGRQQLLERWRMGDSFSNDDWKTVSPVASMNKVLASRYPGYTMNVPDVVRARLFLNDLAQWRKDGAMPNLVVLQLPCDHTAGMSPDFSTAKAMVADNDYALGQIIEGLTQSAFWKKMAIFVVEDDAQNGVDHVDGHRTVALAVSPYTRRGHIDSTFYSNQSMVKTIGLILGLPPLSLFDLIANDMRASFTNTPDYAPYQAIRPEQDLFEKNPALRALKGPARQAAVASSKMMFDLPDAAPTAKLNRILWGDTRGWRTPYPAVRQAVFSPLSLDVEDEEREEKKPPRRAR